jgi:c-di-GMP-binding flagellar brake protein YcgR
MFDPGKSYKVKVETANGDIGFGRATVVEKDNSRLLVQLRTSRDTNQVLPRGTRFWFVGDSAGNVFNGLWATSVVGAKIVSGKTVMECRNPKFEPLLQRRANRRYPLTCPVDHIGLPGSTINYQLTARNISASGLGIETSEPNPREFAPGEKVTVMVHSESGDIAIECNVIRTQFNWLANKCLIGLEFQEMSQASNNALAKLLELLNERHPREDELETDTYGSLSRWMRTTNQNMKIVRPPQSE